MTALFPETQREHYEEAPLVQVICQLKFPKLLKIESKPPAEFQEKIRASFPLMQQVSNLPFNLPPEVSQMLGQQAGQTNYQFMTEDRSHTIALNSESLSLTALTYKNWEGFEGNIKPALDALTQIYTPSFFTRVGLRYVDAIDREKLGLSGTPWSKLLRPELLGELSNLKFENSLEGLANRALRLKNPDGSGSILLQHGMAQNPGKTELVYVIDVDFFSEEKTEIQNAISTLTQFNRLAGNAFRWCITPELRAALKPTFLLQR